MVEAIKALDKYINRAPKSLPLASDLFHFCSIAKSYCCVVAFSKYTLVFWENIFKKFENFFGLKLTFKSVLRHIGSEEGFINYLYLRTESR